MRCTCSAPGKTRTMNLWQAKKNLQIPFLSLATAAFIVLLDNQTFWLKLFAKFGQDSAGHWQLMITLALILTLLHNMLFLAFSSRYTFKPVLLGVLLIAASVSYFVDSYGVVIDKSMIRNMLETNLREAGELLTWPLFRHLLIYGVTPSALIVMLPVHYPPWRMGLLLRAGTLMASFIFALGLFMSDFKGFVLFGRENRQLQAYINPFYPLVSFKKVVGKSFQAQAAEPLQVLAADATREPAGERSVVVLVVGETARAKEFALNGYDRNTNPYTSRLNMINFTDVESCGTATAVSVPCMFSPLGRDRFSLDKAVNSENLLDVLKRAGVKVVWRDNDSGSKGVANRVVYEDFAKEKNETLCPGDTCYDEVLLTDLDKLISESKEDLLIVMHILGSHGPSYYKRTPKELKLFMPECNQDNVQDCSRDTIVNAYDNTIVYTDYILSRMVELLENEGGSSALLYVSDHGESLGENGIYLHGLPYAFAPEEQTHVPMQFWASSDFSRVHGIDLSSLQTRRQTTFSHDNLFHTMLGLYRVKTAIYNPDLDIFRTSGEQRG